MRRINRIMDKIWMALSPTYILRNKMIERESILRSYGGRTNLDEAVAKLQPGYTWPHRGLDPFERRKVGRGIAEMNHLTYEEKIALANTIDEQRKWEQRQQLEQQMSQQQRPVLPYAGPPPVPYHERKLPPCPSDITSGNQNTAIGWKNRRAAKPVCEYCGGKRVSKYGACEGCGHTLEKE